MLNWSREPVVKLKTLFPKKVLEDNFFPLRLNCANIFTKTLQRGPLFYLIVLRVVKKLNVSLSGKPWVGS